MRFMLAFVLFRQMDINSIIDERTENADDDLLLVGDRPASAHFGDLVDARELKSPK